MPERKSPLKQLANQRNAQKSTGPKTPQGKARVAQNPRKHGILSKEVVVKDGDGKENATEFGKLIEGLLAQSPPQDAIERLLIDRVAACYWRLRRAQRFEIGAVREGLDDCKIPLEEPGPNIRAHEAQVRCWRGMLDIKRRSHEKSLKTSRRSSGFRHAADADLAATHKPDHRSVDGSEPASGNPAAAEPEDPFSEAEEALREYESLTEIAEFQDEQAESRRPFLAALPADEPLNRLIRYETMLDRQLHRALSELRRRRRPIAFQAEPEAEATGPSEPLPPDKPVLTIPGAS